MYYFSTDQAPVRVKLFNQKLGKVGIANVPRAYIVWLSDRLASDGPLPNEIDADQFDIMFTDRGEPWTVAVSKLANDNKISITDAGASLRPSMIWAIIRTTSKPGRMAKMAAGDKARYTPQSASAYGLTMYRNGGSSFEYYFGEPGDAFSSVRCAGPQSNKILCGFAVDITSDVDAEVLFSDFRVHGGRDWANERVRFAKREICSLLGRC
ncbi:hypothetical protein IZ6_12570 [Terrihabitans soli]|uniref:Uncharacterized protein n=2 Tax=Terrihabitans soli TaxID=708113 RepID=A0A6S6QTC5_9HYPH|nr:hypothetical protein IZ6_12570 [Terrihabitans soli]